MGEGGWHIQLIYSNKEDLQGAKSLSSGIFNKLFIAPALTKKQKEDDNDLREHVKLFKEEFKDQGSRDKDKRGKVVRNEQVKQNVVLI